MLTNVFRLGFRQISWFELISADGDNVALSEKWSENHFTNKVLVAHTVLQNEGYFSAWTSSDFSGSNGGSFIKLWLFLPGRVETINTSLQSILIGLKVIASGLWIISKDCNEVTNALCQALENRMERGLGSVGYVRFGDVFVKCKAFGSSEPQLRRPLPACEVTFTASEEAIFVHFVLQRKRVRSFSADDIQAALKLHHDVNREEKNSHLVIAAPHGLSGKLVGCYSSDVIQMLHESKAKGDIDLLEQSSQGASANEHGIGSASGFHAEVSFTFEAPSRLPKGNGLHGAQDMARSFQEKEDKIATKTSYEVEKILLYPPEAVIVPLVPAVPPKVFLKRCWLQNCVGISWLEDELDAGPKLRMNEKSLHTTLKASHGVRSPSSKSSSSSSSSSGASSVENSSSHGSSTSDSDGEAGAPPGELEADAESLVVKGKQMHGSSRSHLDVEIKGFEDVAALVKWGQSGGPAQGEASALKGMKRSSSSGGEISNEGYRSLQNRSDVGVQGMVLSPNVGLGTPKAASSQVGTPWNWPEDDRGLNVGIENDADILAEFGDFGDFFEDDGLGFGEPPGTAESQAMMFPLTDCLDGMGSPGNGCLDYTDPMLLPILDIPVLEGLEPEPIPVKELKPAGCVSGSQELPESLKSPEMAPNNQITALNTLSKEEAVLLLAPGYEPVSLPSGRDLSQQTAVKSPYIPGARKVQLDVARGSECYVYGATPPPSPTLQVQERKRDHYEMVSDRAVLSGKRSKNAGTQSKLSKQKSYPNLLDMTEKVPTEKLSLLGKKAPVKESAWMEPGAGQFVPRRFSTTLLATEINCILLQLTSLQARDAHLVKNIGAAQFSSGNTKELPLDSIAATESGPFSVKVGMGIQQEKKKKDRIPSRIAGDMDEEVPDGPRVSQIGVWRPVGTPKPQRAPNSASWNENTQTSSAVTSLDSGAGVSFETSSSITKTNHWQELLDTLPLLIQQGSVLFDVSLDGDCGEGPFGWLSSQEQERLKSVCGPGAIHAGCGGTLCASHFLDNAGVELLDPLTSEISARSVATILQSDMRIAMATAFGDSLLDGPLSLGEWLKGRAFFSDTYGTDSGLSDSKEIASTVLAGIGEPITPPQCTTGPAGLKASTHDIESQPCDTHRSNSSWAMEGSSLSDDGCTRRCGQETGSIETDAQLSSGRGGPTVMALPMPALLVGYQDDWLKVSSSTLHLWEKAPLEPYATAKPVIYYVVCPKIDPLLSATAEYIQQLSCVYEACMLGSHVAGNMMFGQNNLLPATIGKSSFSGFLAMDYPLQTPQQQGQLDSACALNNFVTNFGKVWNPHEFLKALSKACKSLPVSGNNTAQREHENSPCLAYYVICPSSDPNTVLQTMLVACQSIGHNYAIYDKQRKASVSNRTSLGSTYIEDSAGSQGIAGFSTSKIVLQVLTAENVFKPSRPISVNMDSLKEVAFSVYNKIRRIPRPYSSSDFIVHGTQPSRGRTLAFQSSSAMSGMWKDCGLVRSTVAGAALPGHESLLDSSSFRSSNWESSWQQQGVSNETSMINHGHQLHDSLKYLFEPLFILAEPGTLDHGVGISASRFLGLDDLSGNVLVGATEATHGTIADSSADYDVTSGGDQKPANFHCSYGWTEDWQWLVSVWTDARGELLDVHLFPAGASGRWDSKTLHNLLVQVLMHGCQLLLMANGISSKPRALVITRIGAFFELECQEWQKAVFTVGGAEIKKWPVQIWQQQLDNNVVTGSSSSLHAQDVSTLAERAMALGGGMPSSPGPSSLFLSRNKPANFVKTEMGGSSLRKQAGSGICHGQVDACRGAFHLVHSISFVNCMLDHTLQIVGLHDVGGSQSAAGIGPPNSVSSNWLNSSSTSVLTALGTGLGSVKTLATATGSYMFVPAHGIRFLSSAPLQLPVCNASELSVPEQVVRKTGIAATIASAFIVSKAVPSIRTEPNKSAEEWPSTLFVGLVGYMSSFVGPNLQAVGQSTSLGNDALLKAKLPKPMSNDGGSDNNLEAHVVVEAVAAELQALSWLSVSPTLPFRRSALPFHCDIVQRLRRLLQYAVNESSGLHDL